jgi:hypothetical protein
LLRHRGGRNHEQHHSTEKFNFHVGSLNDDGIHGVQHVRQMPDAAADDGQPVSALRTTLLLACQLAERLSLPLSALARADWFAAVARVAAQVVSKPAVPVFAVWRFSRCCVVVRFAV